MNNDYEIERVAFSLKGAGKEFHGELGGGHMEFVRGASPGSAGGVRSEAPLAAREPVEHVIHGDRRVDHYAWMRDKQDPRVMAYLEAENAYADLEMKGTEAFQEKLYQEMLGRIQQTDLSVPYLLRGYEYYTRTEEGKQYPIYCRRKVGSEEQELASAGEEGYPISDVRDQEARSSGATTFAGNAQDKPGSRVPVADKLLEELRAELRRGFGPGVIERRGEAQVEGDTERESPSAQADQEGGEPGPPRSQTGVPMAQKPVPQEEVLLDLNEMAAGHTFMGLGIFEVSDDSRYLAYATDTTGYRQYVLEVKDLQTGSLIGGEKKELTQSAQSEERKGPGDIQEGSGSLPAGGSEKTGHFRVERVTSAAWAMDSQTLFYVTEDEVTKRSNQLWRHEFKEVARGEGRRTRVEQSSERGDAEGAEKAQREEGSLARSGLGMPETNEESSVQALRDSGRRGEERPASEGGPYGGTDELIYEEKDERFRMDVERSRSGSYLFLVVNSHTASEVRYLRADSPFSGFQLVADREDEHEYYIDHHPGSANDEAGGVFFIRTNSRGRTYRLVTAPVENPERMRWREVIANRPGVMLAGLEAFRTHLVLTEREDGLPHLRILDLTREAPSALAASWRMEFAEPAYHAMLGTNPEFDSDTVRFQYESLVTPRSVYDYDLRTGARILKKQQPVLGDFDAGNYVSERLHARATDGTLVPISVVRRKETMRDGLAPLLLYGYGSYGFSMPAMFNSNRLSLLDRGMVYAIAHVRGGGELGKPWHDAGRMHQKMNTFTDFIACADYLIGKRYTSPDRLVIEGGSAGGLLMGAVVNLQPELFHAVVSHVPFVDVLNTMLDPSLPLTVGEYEEWGNPQLADDYFYMKQYCPYTNVERRAYPRMLVKTAWNDSQVMYWEAAKYVAKLRTMKADGNVLLLKTNMGAGHGGASGRYDFLREIAMDYAFMLREVGITE